MVPAERRSARSRTRCIISAALFGAMNLASIAGCGDDDNVAQGIDESFLDRSVSPCTDFYQFACGTWIAEHPTGESAAVERFLEGDGRSSFLLEKILDADSRHIPYVPHEHSDDLGNYYQSCMTSRNTPTIDRSVIDPQIGRA